MEEGKPLVVAVSQEGIRRVVALSLVFPAAAQQRSGYWSAAEFVDLQAGVVTTPCAGTTCVYYRGKVYGAVEPVVYLDEILM